MHGVNYLGPKVSLVRGHAGRSEPIRLNKDEDWPSFMNEDVQMIPYSLQAIALRVSKLDAIVESLCALSVTLHGLLVEASVCHDRTPLYTYSAHSLLQIKGFAMLEAHTAYSLGASSKRSASQPLPPNTFHTSTSTLYTTGQRRSRTSSHFLHLSCPKKRVV